MFARTLTPSEKPRTEAVAMSAVAFRTTETHPAANDDGGTSGPKLLERRRRRTQRRSIR